MTFSIIVCAYNIQEYIDDCIDSIINQSFKDFEVILVDDCSFDKTKEICEKYDTQYSFIKLIRHTENMGIVCARKTGIKNSTGDYLIFVDGDDFLSEKYLEKMYEIINLHDDVDLICCNHFCFYENNEIKKITRLENEIFDKSKIDSELFPHLILDENGKSFPQTMWAKVFKRELNRFNQGDYDNGMRYSEDSAMFCPYAFKCKLIITVNDALYYYRINHKSSTRIKKPLLWEDVYKYQRHIKNNLPMDLYDFQNQLNRYMVYMIFIVGSTQFNMDIKKKEIIKQIEKKLNDSVLISYIKNAKFKSKNGKIIQFVLKHKLYFVMKKYNNTR